MIGWCPCNERIIADPTTGMIYLLSITMGRDEMAHDGFYHALLLLGLGSVPQLP
jgi:hypothetical protein